jgi:Skp family chaperone for outer membrane proteins
MAVPGLTQAQDKLPPAVIAVLDSQFVIVNGQASQGIRTQIEAIRDVYSEEIKALEDELRSDEDELKRQQAILAPDIFAERRRDWEDRLAYVERLVEERNRQIDRSFNDAMNQVREAVLSVIVEMTEQRGFNIILEKGELVFAARTLDITDDIIIALDEALPNVDVPMPK